MYTLEIEVAAQSPDADLGECGFYCANDNFSDRIFK